MIENFKLKRVTKINAGDTIYYEEDVFIRYGKKHKCIGRRCMILQVVRPGMGGDIILKVIKSAGANAEPVGVHISRPPANLTSGYNLNDITFDDKMESGGHLEGKDGGKNVKMDDASKGGMSVGASHEDGGIKGLVGSEKKPIEFQGEEIILTAPVASSTEKYDFDGQQLTGREIASKINVDNGGVSFADGGEVPCKCGGKMYNFGGVTTLSDRDILKYLNFMSQSVPDRILYLKK